MSSDSKGMKYGVPNPFGKITVHEIPIETKAEADYVRSDMVIDDGKT